MVEGYDFPFTTFEKFNIIKEEEGVVDKLFISGPSGVGKSRCIYEIFKNNINRYQKIIVINPRNSITENYKRAPLLDIISKINEDDAIIWDNFPDGLIKKDRSNLHDILELISSCNSKKAIISLKPSYLEVIGNITADIPDYHSERISYSKEELKQIIKSYGSRISEYKDVYEKEIVTDLDKITNILWQKEPTPLTILDYYNELIDKERQKDTKVKDANIKITSPSYSNRTAIHHINNPAVLVAEKLLRSTTYYKHQFELLSHVKGREGDMDFLYTLKLCFDLEIEPTLHKVESLQKEMFGTRPVSYTGLRNWVYFSGQICSMHDVCRDTILLEDNILSNILHHISDNFVKFISNNYSSSMTRINTLALFLGKNVKYLPRNDSNPFVPDIIYQYMKKNVSFERAFGQGVGEVFESLEENLQKTMTSRIDTEIHFTIGMGESLGYRFFSIEKNPIFKKIKDDFNFAHNFGNSVGKLIPYLSEEHRKQIFETAKSNPYLLDGLGSGIGSIYESLDENLQKEMFANAKSDSEMMRGLGQGSGLKFSNSSPLSSSATFNKSYQNKIFRIGDNYNEFDFGLGYALGGGYKRFSIPIQKKILQRLKDNAFFSYGIGFCAMNTNPNDCPPELINMIQSNGGLAFGIGSGLGINFNYLTDKSKSFFMPKLKENIRLSIGYAAGLGLAFNQLDKEKQDTYLKSVNFNETFAEGLAYGLGVTWIYHKSKFQDYMTAKIITNNNRFAYGLGSGMGPRLNYNDSTTQKKILKWAETNSEFDKGLGLGMGVVFPYLGSLADEILLRASTNSSFAFGLGTGLGWNFKYLPSEDKERIYEKASLNGMFSRGFGYGIGVYTVNYSNDVLINELLLRSKKDNDFALGLGEGIGYSFRYQCNKLLNKILEKVIKENSYFSRGLGIGLGKSLNYQSSPPPLQLQKTIYQIAENDFNFALGLGEGIGSIFSYLDKTMQDELLLKATSVESAFTKGLGIGIGSVFNYLSPQLQNKIMFYKTMQNVQFTKGLGIGIGSVFNYLSPQLQKTIFNKMAENDFNFALGLGEGIGSIFSYLDKTMQKDFALRVKEDRYKEREDGNNYPSLGFAMGIGIGIGAQCYKYYFDNDDYNHNYFNQFTTNSDNLLSSNTYFAKGLGIGTASTVSLLYLEDKNDLNLKLLKILYSNFKFAESFGFGIAIIFPYLTSEKRVYITTKSGQPFSSIYFACGLGKGLGYIFHLFDEKIKQEIVKKIEYDPFAYGLGLGIGRNFNNLKEDSISQNALFDYMNKYLAFAYGLGKGLGYRFPSLDANLQESILLTLEKRSNLSFNYGFLNSINDKLLLLLNYLDKNLQKRILNLVEYQKQEQQKQKQNNNDNDDKLFHSLDDELYNENDESLYNLFPAINFVVDVSRQGPRREHEQNQQQPQQQIIQKNKKQQLKEIEEKENNPLYLDKKEIRFLGKRKSCCVCFIDIVNSTKITEELEQDQIKTYYSLFLNAMATISFNFGGQIIKNAGDGLIIYFPNTTFNTATAAAAENENNINLKFKNIIDCGITMLSARKSINTIHFERKLPPINYRISMDYGIVEQAKSQSSKSIDLFGPTMNVCAKINSKANPNEMVIGENLYEKVKSLSDFYYFDPCSDFVRGFKSKLYHIYQVKSKDENILNPFKNKSM